MKERQACLSLLSPFFASLTSFSRRILGIAVVPRVAEGFLSRVSSGRGRQQQAGFDFFFSTLRAAALDACPICHEQFAENDLVLRLSPDASQCSHVFHDGCLRPWLDRVRLALPQTFSALHVAGRRGMRNSLPTTTKASRQRVSVVVFFFFFCRTTRAQYAASRSLPKQSAAVAR